MHPYTSPHAPRCAGADMVPLRLRFSQLLYDAIYLDLPPPFSVPPATLLVAAAAAVGAASADELLPEEPFA